MYMFAMFKRVRLLNSHPLIGILLHALDFQIVTILISPQAGVATKATATKYIQRKI